MSRCVSRGRRYACPACHLSIDATKVDYVIERAVLKLLDGRTWRRLQRRGRQPVDTSALETELLELAQQRADGEITAEEWTILRAGLVKRLLLLLLLLLLEDAAAEPVPLPSIENVRATWPDLTIDERRLIVTAVVERLAVRPGIRGLPRFDPDRLELEMVAA